MTLGVARAAGGIDGLDAGGAGGGAGRDADGGGAGGVRCGGRVIDQLWRAAPRRAIFESSMASITRAKAHRWCRGMMQMCGKIEPSPQPHPGPPGANDQHGVSQGTRRGAC